MRKCQTVADPGVAEFLARENRAQNLAVAQPGMSRHQGAELLQQLFFAGGSKVARHDIGRESSFGH